MRTLTLITAALTFAFALSGCAAGILYTHTVAPLTVNHLEMPAAGNEGQSEIKHIQLPQPVLGIMWGDTSLGDIARAQGMRELSYADLEYLSVLTIWRQYTVHLYGK